MQPKTKILLVDDHPLVRDWLASLINGEPDMEICGQCGNARETLGVMEKLSPDMAVVDLSLANSSGLELIKDIKSLHPATRIIVLSMHDESLYAERAMRAGAAGYVMKSEVSDKVLGAIRTVAGGGVFFSSDVNALITRKIIQGGDARQSGLDALSDRELEVFRLLGQGKNTRQISQDLNVSFKTVHAYCGRIKDKLNFSSINDLTFHAVRWHENQPH